MEVDPKSAKESLNASSVIETDFLCTQNLSVAEKELLSDNQVILLVSSKQHFLKRCVMRLNSKKITTDLINIDIRDRAGWTEDKNAFAKQAALLSEIDLETPETPIKEIVSKVFV